MNLLHSTERFLPTIPVTYGESTLPRDCQSPARDTQSPYLPGDFYMTAAPAGNGIDLRTRLQNSLSQLESTIEASHSHASESDQLYRDWRAEWQKNSDELNEKLSILERKLNESLGKPGWPTHLKIVCE